MPTMDDIQTWKGQTVYGPGEQKIGEVADVYLDRHNGEPAWLAVKTGFFGMSSSFVPIREAVAGADGVTVPYDKGKVKDAPNVEADGELSPEEERRLYEHYGVSWGEFDYDATRDPVAETGRAGEPGGRLRRI